MHFKKSTLIKTFWEQYAYIYGLFAIAVVSPLFSTIGTQTTFLISHNVTPFILISTVFMTSLGIPSFFVLLKLILIKINKKYAGKIFDSLYLFLMIFLLSQNLLNKHASGLVFLPGIEVMAYLLIGLTISLFCLLLYFRKTVFRDIIRITSFGAVILPVFLLAFTPASTIVKKASITQIGGNSVKNPVPIVIVIFDEFSLTSLLDSGGNIDQARYPNFSLLSQTANWYPNAKTIASNTDLAIPAILSGQATHLELDNKPQLHYYPQNLFTWLQDKYSYFNIVEQITQLAPRRLVKKGFNRKMFFSDYFTLPFYSYLHKTIESKIFPSLPAAWSNFGFFYSHEEKDEFLTLLNQWCNNLKAGNSLNYFHSLPPHRPLEYLPSGRTYLNSFIPIGTDVQKNSTTPSLINFAHHQYLLQVGYIDKVLGKIIKSMKQKDIFDNSLLIISADHGVAYTAAAEYNRLSLNDHGLAYIAFIPVFIKFPKQTIGKKINKTITIMDYLPTISEVIQTEIPWETNGISVLSSTYPEFKEYNLTNKRIYYSPTVNGKRVGYRSYNPAEIEKVFHRELKRISAIFGSGAPYSRSLVNYTEKVEYDILLGKSVNEYSVSNTDEYRIQWDLVQPTFLKGNLASSSNNADDILLAIAIDQRIVAVTKPSKWQDSDHFFAVMLPEEYFNYKTDLNLIGFYYITKHRSFFELHEISGELLSLKNQFKNLKNVKLRFRPEEFIKGVGKRRYDISSMVVDGSNVIITSTGNDPHFSLPSFQIIPNVSYVIKVDITVPSKTGLQLFYKTIDKPYFVAFQDVGMELKKGRNAIYLKVPGPNLVEQFRLDPGSKEGKYTLHDLEVRELPLHSQKK